TPANDLVTGEVLASSSIVAAQVNVAGAVAGTTYTLSAAGTTGLTLTATVGSNTVSQSVAVSAMTSSAASSQTLNFSTLGVSISLQGFDGTKGTVANIVADLKAPANDTIVTNAGTASAQFQVGANSGQTVSVSIDSAMSNAANGGSTGNFGQTGTYANLA